VEAAWRKGIVVVVAVGNDGANASRVSMPAANPYVLAVGAADPKGTDKRSDDTVASFSSRGSMSERRADLVAAGRSVVSLRNPNSFIDVNYPTGLVPGDSAGRFFRGSGTSQATAIVSGAAALLLQSRPTLKPDQVKRLLMTTAESMPAADSVARGAGQLNLDGALKAPTPNYVQTHFPSMGTGSLEQSRGSAHVTDPDTGTDLTGEQDIMGQAWDAGTWAKACTAGTTWTDGTWNGRTWAGSGWTGTSWAGRTWGSLNWQGTNWAGRTWGGRTWADVQWDGRTWGGRTWGGRTWAGRTWGGDYWASSSWS
jgi:serine protease AprX